MLEVLGAVGVQVDAIGEGNAAAASWTFLCLSTVFGLRGSGGRGLHDAVEVPGHGPFETPADVAVSLAFKGAPGFVGPGFSIASDAGDRDGVQCPIQCAVSAAVQAVSGALAAAGLQGCNAGQCGKCRFASDPPGVGPADEQLGCDDRSHAGFGEQGRASRVFLYQTGQLGIDVRELDGQEPDVRGDRLQGQDRDPVFDRGGRGADGAFDQYQLGGQQTAAPERPKLFRCDHNEAFEFIDGLGAAEKHRLAGR